MFDGRGSEKEREKTNIALIYSLQENSRFTKRLFLGLIV